LFAACGGWPGGVVVRALACDLKGCGLFTPG